MSLRHITPDKEAIALLPPFERLGLDRITLVRSGAQAQHALAQLQKVSAWGFDTESKPTFKVGEASDGPHVLQLSTSEHAWVFQLHDAACRNVAAELLAQPGIVKAGFGLGDDRRRCDQQLGQCAAERIAAGLCGQRRLCSDSRVGGAEFGMIHRALKP